MVWEIRFSKQWRLKIENPFSPALKGADFLISSIVENFAKVLCLALWLSCEKGIFLRQSLDLYELWQSWGPWQSWILFWALDWAKAQFSHSFLIRCLKATAIDILFKALRNLQFLSAIQWAWQAGWKLGEKIRFSLKNQNRKSVSPALKGADFLLSSVWKNFAKVLCLVLWLSCEKGVFLRQSLDLDELWQSWRMGKFGVKLG